MEIEGNIRKMRTILSDPVDYFLAFMDKEIYMNDLLGLEIRMEYSNEIHCIKCGRKTNKSFAQGFCYPCFISAPETEDCVLRPELCMAHEGVARDMDYARNNCLIEHVVYLSLTSDIKVGVTRSTQVPTRWIDQGATQAIELARTPNRHVAGLIEVFLKDHLKDKTNWMAMLKNDIHLDADLVREKQKALALLPDAYANLASTDDTVTFLNYPVREYPLKVKSLNFEKDPVVQGRLRGIKGQYLLFEDNTVINLRKYGGYRIKFDFLS